MSLKLIDDLGTSKEKLYSKYREWRSWKWKTNLLPEIQISEIFGIDRENKEAIFYILKGLETVKKDIKSIQVEGVTPSIDVDIDDIIYGRVVK
jgi:hypothetical protein